MNAGDVPPVSRSGSSPESQTVSDSNRQGFRRRRGPGGKGRPAPRQDPPPEESAAIAALPGADDDDVHSVDVRA